MILPTKHVPLDRSLLGVAAVLLENYRTGDTVSSLWYRVTDRTSGVSFFQYSLALDLLFMMGLVELKANQLLRVKPFESTSRTVSDAP